MRFTVLTLFPNWFDGPFGEGILGRARAQGIVELRADNFRRFTTDKHQSVDDAPYGGGGGMLLRPGPVCAALDELAGAPGTPGRAHVIYTSPRGGTFDQRRARELADAGRDIAILCGRYEGLDERVIATRIDEELSLGDFVMTGGEPAALAFIDAIVRLLPGALGNEDSAPNDSFYDGLLEAPHYTRPEVFEGLTVPPELLSGNHALVAKWRKGMSLRITRERRPELYERWREAHREELEMERLREEKRLRRRRRKDGPTV